MKKSNSEIEALRDVSFDEFDAAKDQMPNLVRKRCQFILEENQRVLDLAKPLSENDSDTLKELFNTSYFGARDLFEIGAPAMEEMYQSMLNAPGVVAARQTGAGFGGCMVALVNNDQVDEFAKDVQYKYKAETGIEPDIYSVSPSAGAGLLEY